MSLRFSSNQWNIRIKQALPDPSMCTDTRYTSTIAQANFEFGRVPIFMWQFLPHLFLCLVAYSRAKRNGRKQRAQLFTAAACNEFVCVCVSVLFARSFQFDWSWTHSQFSSSFHRCKKATHITHIVRLLRHNWSIILERVSIPEERILPTEKRSFEMLGSNAKGYAHSNNNNSTHVAFALRILRLRLCSEKQRDTN